MRRYSRAISLVRVLLIVAGLGGVLILTNSLWTQSASPDRIGWALIAIGFLGSVCAEIAQGRRESD